MNETNYQKNYTTNLQKRIRDNCLRVTGYPIFAINKYKKDWFIKRDILDLYDDILSITDDIETDDICERLYCIMHDIHKIPKCVCGNTVKFEMYSRGYRQYCSVKCRANDPVWVQHYKDTMIEIYGVDHPTKVESLCKSKSEKLKDHSYFVTRTKANIIDDTKKSHQTLKLKYNGVNTGWLPHAIETRLRNRSIVPNSERKLYEIYTLAVKRFTKLTIKLHSDKIKDINLRDNHANNPKAYHIDHTYSKYDGFKNSVPPYIIGHWTNLRCIPFKENLKKQKNSDILIDTLFERYFDAKI